MKEISVVELFAGVGGFSVGLDRANIKGKDCTFRTLWANQWEPSTKIQHAAMVYKARFPKVAFSNEDINSVIDNHFADIPDHDFLVGGFPCQDYSVASTLSRSKGIEGKKGVLWWSIYNILVKKGERKPSMLLLENVDRLLLSPAKQRGRDFAIILECLNELGYIVEWRVINAADYGMPQKRRRTYIMAYLKDSVIGLQFTSAENLLTMDGVLAKAFPLVVKDGCAISSVRLSDASRNRLVDISNNFNSTRNDSPFLHAGVMIDGTAFSVDYRSGYSGYHMCLRDIMATRESRPDDIEDFYIPENQINRWKYFKGSKREERTNKSGYKYFYSEGGMEFPDSLDRPSRTIITSEGGKSPDRCRHAIEDETGRIRRLTPLELERLNMFPDNHTAIPGVDNGKRAFLMGNALVCGIVTMVGEEIIRRIN